MATEDVSCVRDVEQASKLLELFAAEEVNEINFMVCIIWNIHRRKWARSWSSY